MAISFNYQKLPGKKGTDHKTPSIKINIKGRAKYSQNVIALIDSGADLSVIPKDIAELLDVDLSGEETVSHGISGEVKVKESKIRINIKKGHEDYSFVIPIQIILSGDPPVILGRRGFFDKFKITIDEKNQKVMLKRQAD